jgi:small subunit ribosomal protein S9
MENQKYFQSTGRRKTAVANVKIFLDDGGKILINGKELKEYFSSPFLQNIVLSPLEIVKLQNKFKILVEVKGGGKNSQAEAIRHGIARALVKFNSDFKRKLKKAGFLKRDPRMKERKKPGLKRARRAPQWQKR